MSTSIQKVDYGQKPTCGAIYESLHKQYNDHNQKIHEDIAAIGSTREDVELFNQGLANRSCQLTPDELKKKAEEAETVFKRISGTLELVKTLDSELDAAIKYIDPSLKRLTTDDLRVLDPAFVPTHETALKHLKVLQEESKDIKTILSRMIARIKPLESSLKTFLAQANPPPKSNGWGLSNLLRRSSMSENSTMEEPKEPSPVSAAAKESKETSQTPTSSTPIDEFFIVEVEEKDPSKPPAEKTASAPQKPEESKKEIPEQVKKEAEPSSTPQKPQEVKKETPEQPKQEVESSSIVLKPEGLEEEIPEKPKADAQKNPVSKLKQRKKNNKPSPKHRGHNSSSKSNHKKTTKKD